MIVLITGCSSGFGLLTALSFARRGDRVFATMRDTSKATRLLGLASAEGLSIDVLQLDVTDDVSVDRAVTQVVSDAGPIDVLVNNAAISPFAPVETCDDAQIRATFETNFFGVLRMLRAVIPMMRERRSGVVINVSSLAGLIPMTWNSIYSASKHALEAMTESLAIEVQPFGIRVALIQPGFYKTSISDNVMAMSRLSTDSPYYEHVKQALEAMNAAVARGGDPQEVADAIVETALSDNPRLRRPMGAGQLLAPAGDSGEWAMMMKRVSLPAR